jgi:hypothetical protein
MALFLDVGMVCLLYMGGATSKAIVGGKRALQLQAV